MMKIILYFIIISFIYNIWKNIKISFTPSKHNNIRNKTKNHKFSNKNDDILDGEFEDIK